jgi:hypothetical protein
MLPRERNRLSFRIPFLFEGVADGTVAIIALLIVFVFLTMGLRWW